MHLSPIKGAFPHKDQHDRTAPVATGNEGIQRGTVIRIEEGTDGIGRWVIAANASTYPMYLALQPYGDLQAAMAGQFSPASGKAEDHPWKTNPNFKRDAAGNYSNAVLQGGIEPAISGIHMDDGDVWETDMFDENAEWDAATLNAKLTVKEGLITCDGVTDENCVGFLVAKPYTRYCNDAPAVKGMMTGASRWVIQFQCGK